MYALQPPPVLGFPQSYRPQNARLRELAHLRKPDLLARYLRAGAPVNGRAYDRTMIGMDLVFAAGLTRDQLIARLLEAG